MEKKDQANQGIKEGKMGLLYLFLMQITFLSLLGTPLEHNIDRQGSMVKLNPMQLVVQHSPYSVSETAEKLEKAIKAKGMMVFAVIDHSGEAQKVNMALHDEKVIIFGDPKVGTFLMQENPSIGMELPLRILVWENEEGLVQVAYLEPTSLGESYEISRNSEILKKMSFGIANLIGEAIQQSSPL